MSFNWQDTIAMMVVALAAIYLLRAARTALAGKKGTACGGCPKCASGVSSSGMTPANERLVILDLPLMQSKPKPR